jgi:hypothetical protein
MLIDIWNHAPTSFHSLSLSIFSPRSLTAYYRLCRRCALLPVDLMPYVSTLRPSLPADPLPSTPTPPHRCLPARHCLLPIYRPHARSGVCRCRILPPPNALAPPCPPTLVLLPLPVPRTSCTGGRARTIRPPSSLPATASRHRQHQSSN